MSAGKAFARVYSQLDRHLTPWELSATIERNLSDDRSSTWLGFYKALYYTDKEDCPLGINHWFVLLSLVFEWRVKNGI